MLIRRSSGNGGGVDTCEGGMIVDAKVWSQSLISLLCNVVRVAVIRNVLYGVFDLGASNFLCPCETSLLPATGRIPGAMVEKSEVVGLVSAGSCAGGGGRGGGGEEDEEEV